MSLLDLIRQTIRHQGAIPFVDFMQMALYAPQYGYYQKMTEIGAEGDFVTAPALTSLFGYTLANQCVDIFQTLNQPRILEFGAGTGHLCVDLLSELERQHALPLEYFILEVSAGLKARQQARIHQAIPHLASRVKWISTWPKEPFEGVMIANEVLDAMPVHRFLQTETELLEYYVDLDVKDELVEQLVVCKNLRLIEHVKAFLPQNIYPYQSEANLFIDDWIKKCHNSLIKGVLIIFDYGFPRREYYHPDRFQGTLMCHSQHRVHGNPLMQVGDQDITAHVDFTHVAEAADKAGFQVTGYTNQAAFLLGNQLLDRLAQVEPSEQLAQQQAVKKLLQPNEMGELFKVMALSKNLDIPLKGFIFQDKRASLA